jgi:hypothetical protein
MGFVDPLSSMPAQQAVKPPVDLEKWADQVVEKAAKFIQDHLATPQPAANAQTANAQTQTTAQPAATQPAAETQKVQAPPEAKSANMLDGVFSAWSRVHGRLDDLVKRDRGYRDAMREDPTIKDRRPEIREFYDNYNMNLLALQMEMGDVSFAMEVASKMIEHGTSAAKTAMQTQV